MAITNVHQLTNMRRQFQGVFDTVIEFEAVYDPPSIASNGNTSDDITIQGAKLGDIVLMSLVIDIQNLMIGGYVSATNVVTINAHNPTAGAINLGSTDIHIIILRPYHKH